MGIVVEVEFWFGSRCEKVLKVDAKLAFTALDTLEIRMLRHEGQARHEAESAVAEHVPRDGRPGWEHRA